MWSCVWQRFLKYNTQKIIINKKILNDKLDFSKLKICFQKKLNTMKRHATDWECIFAKHISNGLVIRIGNFSSVKIFLYLLSCLPLIVARRNIQ